MAVSDSTDPHAQDFVYPRTLADEENLLVTERRHAAGLGRPPTKGTLAERRVLGVGLSGGGIRSATFSLGVFQALASRKLVRHVDILSTVSGGGYFGSFLGRLFTRDWITGPADVEAVLCGDEIPSAPGHGPRPFRWLRESSRYLAPRGSGDLFVLGAVVLRNWIAVQVALVVTILTAFVALQIGRSGVDAFLALPAGRPLLAVLTTLPGSGWLWWSPWLPVAVAPFVLVSMPSAWAYWMVARREEKRGGWAPWAGLFLLSMLGAAGTVHLALWRADVVLHPYRWLVAFVPLALVATRLGRMRTDHRPGALGWTVLTLTALASMSGMAYYWPLRDGLHYVAVFVLIVTAMAFAFWRVAIFLAIAPRSSVSWVNELRGGLTRWTTRGLEWTGLALAVALVDTLGATIYYFFAQPGSSLGLWGAGLLASFVTVGTFARQASLLLAPRKADARPRVPTSILLWGAAILVSALWLVAINAGSHAIAWQFGPPPESAPLYKPADFPPPTLLGNDQVVVERRDGGFVIRGERVSPPPPTAVTPERPDTWFLLISLTLLASFTWMIGRTRSFINLSSVHALYAARLTRAYLGASNRQRFDGTKRITESIEGDDVDSQDYWCWPCQGTRPDPTRGHTRPTQHGGPLHVINATINETMNVRSGVQNQDRKGLSLAIGPCAISVGASHHLVTSVDGRDAVAFGPDDAVFDPKNPAATTPEELSLGRWMSISGAAFSAAAGANTSVPVAILAGLFNVRLGYWWDSGNPPGAWSLERLLPVQAALLAEMLARTKGTDGQWWNISDGGHFENMAGYELVRRRLPYIVIVDAEADPDFTFQGLSDLIRKARLDFGAEITFLSEKDLNDPAKVGTLVPSEVRHYFGDLDALRRGHWSEESVPMPDVEKRVKRLSFRADRTHVSRAHAALASVTYNDEGAEARHWLIYIKATMMGDEPEDVRQYHRAHPDFPQETTNDQFFDERQWESYRRLGQHIGARVLAPVLEHVVKRQAP